MIRSSRLFHLELKMIIGITGKKRSGKDTAAIMLAETLAARDLKTVHIMKYADALKHAIFDGINKTRPFEFTFEDIDGATSYDREEQCFTTFEAIAICTQANRYLELPYSMDEVVHEFFVERDDSFYGNPTFYSVRELLQYYGTEIVRNKHDDNFWVNSTIKKALEISDLNTHVIITDVRFDNEIKVIQENNGKVFSIVRDSANMESDSHISESGISDYQSVLFIENNDTLDDLRNIIQTMEV